MRSRLGSVLPGITELRSIATAIRPGGYPTGSETPGATNPDPDLLAIIGAPFETVDDVHRRLSAAEAYLRQRGDRRSVFLSVYTAMTDRVLARIHSDGFENPDWVRTYLVAFANRYRTAFADYERGREGAIPDAWLIAFRASTDNATILVQDALLGVNAHINYDLTYTLVDVGIDPNRPSKRRDHDRINHILAGLIDGVQRSLADIYRAGGYGDIDAELGSLDEELTLIGLREARTVAWQNASTMTDTRFGILRRFIRWRSALLSAGAAQFILAPSGDPSVLSILRDLEAGDSPTEAALEAISTRLMGDGVDSPGRPAPIDPD